MRRSTFGVAFKARFRFSPIVLALRSLLVLELALVSLCYIKR
jgi:hypothetical protein